MNKAFFLIVIIPVIFNISSFPQEQFITHRGQQIFLSGMNLAWLDFANDLTHFDETRFRQAMEEISAPGGNAVRWWLHVNGRNSPVFLNDMVFGLGENEISNLKKALDIAEEHGIVLILCLWSFDMLQPNAGPENYQRNKLLLTDTIYTGTYILNALIPMVKAVKGHPSLFCWEIFNEPEGMCNDISWAGWTPEKVSINDVQRFINLCAGAIHRTDTHALVSNGAWSFRVATDVGGFTNFYRDDRLVAAGKDPDGVLDFYMVHYYPKHFDESASPFHHPASYWKLDKPLIIGEFPALGIIDKGDGFAPKTEINITDAYEHAYLNGYAGALSWTWTNHDGFGGIEDCSPAIQNLKNNYPEDVTFNLDTVLVNQKKK